MPRDDNPEMDARRTVKSYSDILGRAFKTETFEWNGSTVYSTVVNTFNGRDQVTLSRQFAGTTSSTTYQDTTASYDGFGRKVGQRLPQQDSPGTVFTYNPDGSLQTQTDARGVVTNCEYNNRGLTTGISWDVGSTGVTDTSDVEFEYDNLGNRTQMTDGLGTQVYEYDALSRLIAEIREFDDTLANAPISGNKFRLEYSYHMGGQLKSLTDPYGQQFNYAYDRVSRLESVTGSTSFAGFTDYASNAQYRAWGALKGLDSGNGVSMQTSFDAALRPSEYELKDSANDTAMERSYEYYNDGALKYMEDHMSPKFDRFNRYDHQGRITQGKSGLEARGGSVTDPEVQKLELPYRQSYQYNAFNNMTQRLNLHWGSDSFGQSNFNLNYTYENNRVTNSWWQHDADGRVTQSALPDDYSGNTYDARGSLIKMQVQPEGMNATETTRFYSGDARELKRSIRRQMDEEDPPYGSYWEDDPPKYYVRSSVLGGEVITQTDETGRKTKTNVIAAGAKIVTQNVTFGESGPVETVWFHHGDSSGMSSRSSWHNGLVNPTDGIDGAPAETDPMGANVGQSDPYVEIIIFDPPEWYPEPYFPNFGDSTMMVNGMSVPCTLDGMTINCSTALGMMASGSAIPASLAPYQHMPGFQFNNHGAGVFTYHIPGYFFSTPNGRDDDNTIRIGSNGYQPPQSGSIYVNADPIEVPDPFFYVVGQLPSPPGLTLNMRPFESLNCYTYYQLIYENEHMQSYFNQIWDATVADAQSKYERTGTTPESGFSEFAGIVTIRPEYTHTFWGAAEATKVDGRRFDISSIIANAIARDKSNGGIGQVLLEVHSHTPRGPVFSEAAGPYATERDRPQLRSWDPNLLTADPSSASQDDYIRGAAIGWLGVVVTGRGKVDTYCLRGKASKDELKRTCIPFQRP